MGSKKEQRRTTVGKDYMYINITIFAIKKKLITITRQVVDNPLETLIDRMILYVDLQPHLL